jgi:selenophosphate synthetase-related protein
MVRWLLTAGGSVKVAAVGHVLATALVLADAAKEGKKIVVAMLVVGLILASLPVLGETYMYFRYHRRGRSPH